MSQPNLVTVYWSIWNSGSEHETLRRLGQQADQAHAVRAQRVEDGRVYGCARESLPVKKLRIITAIIALGSVAGVAADDWPQWRGLHRDGIWRENGILQSIPPEGLKILWRVPVGTGFSTPVVVQSRVYVTDSRVTRTNVQENVRCIDAATGMAIWTHTYDAVYPEYGADPNHPFGPHATPVVANGKIYTLGRMSHLLCLDAPTGRVLWSHNLPKEYNTTEDLRGFSSSPVVESNLVIIAIA